MQKDFDAWNEDKKIINIRQDTSGIFFREQEIWWCFLGLNVGYEQDGKGAGYLRPILIIRKFNQYSFVALPLTTKTKMRDYLVPCPALDGVFRQVNVTQLKTLDIKRLDRKISFVSLEPFAIIRKAVREIFPDPLPSKSSGSNEPPEP